MESLPKNLRDQRMQAARRVCRQRDPLPLGSSEVGGAEQEMGELARRGHLGSGGVWGLWKRRRLPTRIDLRPATSNPQGRLGLQRMGYDRRTDKDGNSYISCGPTRRAANRLHRFVRCKTALLPSAGRRDRAVAQAREPWVSVSKH